MIRWIILLPVLLISGCALFSSKPSFLPAQPENVPFAMNGRVSINNNGEKHSAGLRWIHQESSDELLLLAPLGRTVGRIYRDADHATLDSDGKHYQAGDVETLMQQVLNWHLPLDGLHHWVLGLPAKHSSVQIDHDGEGRISLMKQDGWEIQYVRYEDRLPSRLKLSRENLQVQLLIDEWDWEYQ